MGITKEGKSGIKYPGVKTTTDGSGAVIWVESLITQGGCAYPITPSTGMGNGYQVEVANGKKNVWGEDLIFIELESEHSAASTCEGYALAGGRVTNFTSGQGLILMKEVLYTISGKRLPIVFHIGARALTSHSLNVHCGHDDVMGVNDTGWGMVFGKNAQEAGDLAIICRRAAEDSSTPFMNIQDGFLTTHTIENVRLLEPEMMKEYIGHPSEKLYNLMDVNNPVMSGVVQNQDSYMKGKIGQRYYYDRVPKALDDAMDEFYRLTGRKYSSLEGYQIEDAEYVIVGMGSMMESAMAVVDYLRDQRELKVGALNVRVFRPFPGPRIVELIKNVKAISVLERMDNPLAQSNPLSMEVKSSLISGLNGDVGYPLIGKIPVIYSGMVGLGSRDITPSDLVAVYENMFLDRGNRIFTLGIKHELGLGVREQVNIEGEDFFAMRGHSVGGFGSVTTNKVIATVIADVFGFYVQAYPKYGSEKKGLPTNYYLAVSPERIRTHHELDSIDFVPLNDANAFNLGNPFGGLKEGGMLFVHTVDETEEGLWKNIPDYAKAIIYHKKIKLLGLDTIRIARDCSSKSDLVQRMQGIVLLGVFIRSTPYEKRFNISQEELFGGVERSIRKYFGKRGEQVVKDNMNAVRKGYEEVFEVSRELIENDIEGIERGMNTSKARVILGKMEIIETI